MAAPQPAERLTYCGNVHATADLPSFLGALREHAVPVAEAARRDGRAFGLGVWWPAPLAGALAADASLRAALRSELERLALPVWTANVFPYGGFHDAVVKTAVYAPDWSREERLRYTLDCAEVAAWLSPRGAVVPLSTLPLGWQAPAAPPPDLRLMARNLVRCASAFAAIEERTGVCCVLALEPEPCCLVETCAQAIAFFERWVFDEGAWPTQTTDVLRRHLGVCVDLCHLAVVGEDPLQALAALRARGIAVPKIQVSSCLEARSEAGLDRLLAFAEPRWLHQTAAARGARALDLPEVAARRAEFAAGGVVRSHYHVPLYWDEEGPFGSTRREVERVLQALAAAPDRAAAPLLEVETYTWPVLGAPGALGGAAAAAPLADRLARELSFAANVLRG